MTANLKLAFRRLLQAPFVTAVAILSLGMGIGANAAIFSFYHQMLMRPLPVPEPERLVTLSAPGPKSGMTSCNQAGGCDEIFSYPMFRDLQKAQTSFTDIAAHRLFTANLAYRDRTVNGEGVLVSGNYFPVLRLQPAIGRLLSPEDDQKTGESRVAVLSHAYWTSRFDRDPDVLNQTLVVNGQHLTIVGVAPAGFDGTTLGTRPLVFVPITLHALMNPGLPDPGFTNRRFYWVYLFARLRPGASLEGARAQINVPYRAILHDVEVPLQSGVSEQFLAGFRAKQITVDNGSRGQSEVHGEAELPLVLLLGVTGLVLLIACANVANLLLARAASRAGEIAVRLSLGASRRQLVAQLMTESLVLAACGGLAGLLFARWTLDLILSMLPSEAASTLPVGINTSVLLFAAAVTLATGLLFGLFPALHSTNPNLLGTLKDQAGQPGGGRAARWFRSTLATSQIAISMALLVCAGLFTRSLMNVSRVELGIDIERLVTFGVSPELNGYTPERSRALFERLEDELASQPGVAGVTAAVVPAISGSNWGSNVTVEGFEAGPDTDTNARVNAVGPDYFKTLGIPLLAGREFTRADRLGAHRVAIVNETFARKFNLGREAVGKRMRVGRGGPLDIEIVGLVKDAKYSSVKGDVPPVFVQPYRQDERIGSITFYVRTTGSPEQMLRTVERVVAAADSSLPVENLRTMPQQVRENVSLDRMIGTLSASFAILATLLAAVGLYGVLAYTVAQRTREIGVRMALGAAPARIRAMVLRQVGAMTLVGGLIGMLAASWIPGVARTILYQIEGLDPAVAAAAVAALGLVALAAGLVPAQRAARIDPMQALRYE